MINELSIIKAFYNKLFEKIVSNSIAKDYTEKYNSTINNIIQTQLTRIYTGIRLNFEKNYRPPHEVDALYDENTFAIIKQMPFNLFHKTFAGSSDSKKAPFYNRLLKTDGIEWFASFVYSLRNALFHEIISPLDEEWQIIFKSAYLILKKISDICIDTVYSIFSLNEVNDNSIIEYVMNNPVECVNRLADHVELLGASQISLTHFELSNSLITATGIIKLKVKLQNGESDDIMEETGEILSEEPVVIKFNAKLYCDNLDIVSTDNGQKEITFSIADT